LKKPWIEIEHRRRVDIIRDTAAQKFYRPARFSRRQDPVTVWMWIQVVALLVGILTGILFLVHVGVL
jgi:hypothetical protein